jgi:hypothetical protein
MELCDIGGQADYDIVRKPACAGAYVILMCFAADKVAFLPDFESKAKELMEKWSADFEYGVTVIFVTIEGFYNEETSPVKDLSQSPKISLTEIERWAMAERLGAFAYMHCGALTGEGVDEIFEAVGFFP